MLSACSGGDTTDEITLLYPNQAYDPARAQIGLMVAQEWRKLGFDVTATAMDYSQLQQVLAKEPQKFDAFIAGFTGNPERYDPDIMLRQPFICSSSKADVSNYFRYCNKNYDKLVEQQAGEIDVGKRRKLVTQAQQTLAKDAPAVALYHLRTLSAWNSRRFTADTPFTAEGSWYSWALEARPLTDDRTLKVGQTFDIGSANPFAVTDGGNSEYFKLLYDTLTRVTPTGETVPWAAKEWKYVNPTTVEVQLRTDLAFHDGGPVTASDIAYSYKIFKQGEGQAAEYKPFLDPIRSVEARGKYALSFNLSEPYAPLPTTAFSQIFILPQHVWKKVNSRVDFDNTPLVGSGPFRWDYWRKGEEVSLKANPKHFAAPAVDGLLGVTYSNSDAVLRALVSQEIDIEETSLLPSQYKQLSKYRHLKRSAVPDIGVYYLGFNLSTGPFKNREVRKAMTYSIPYDRIVDTVFNGYAEPGQGFIAPANRKWHDQELKPPEYDVSTARKMLRDAGYDVPRD